MGAQKGLEVSAAALAEVCPYVDEIIPNAQRFAFNDVRAIFQWNLNLASRLLRRRYDIAYAFASQGSTILLAYMSGARERISHKYSEDERAVGAPIDLPLHFIAPLLTVKVPRNFIGSPHEADDYLGLLDHQLHAPIDNREIEVWLTPSDRTTAETLVRADDRKAYALCMGGSAQRKQWQPQKYAQLAEKILEREPDVKFIILGGGKPDEQSAAIFKQSIDQKYLERVIDLTNKSNFRLDCAIMSLCELYIGNDTGNMIMASAVKLPVLNPNCFAADLPMTDASILKVFHPYRVPSVIVQPKHALDECRNSTEGYGCTHIERHCIGQIEVETVFKAYRRLKKRIAENSLEPLFVS